LGGDADAWIIVPVSAHRALVERVAKAKGFSVSDSALNRTSVLYIGLFPEGDVRLLATGSFPKSASSVVFPKSRGWERAGADSGVTWYRSGAMGASIPRSGLFAMSRDMPALLANLARFDVASQALPEELSDYLDSPERDGRVAFMTTSPRASLAGFLPPGMTVPIEHALFFARAVEGGAPGAGRDYALDGYLQANDERSSRAVAAMVKLATGTRPRVELARVYLDGWIVNYDTLAALAGF
jgi:hypothetical protein